MRKDEFKHRCEMRMKSFGITTEALGAMFGKAKTRVIEALRGDNTDAARSLRVQIDLKLTGLCDEERARMAAEIEEARDIVCPHIKGKISVILPEDLLYIVTEDGIPVGAWNPQSKTYRELDAAVLPVIGRKVK